MAERTTGIYRLIGVPAIYAALQDVLGARVGRRRVVREIIRPKAGDRMLDLGCGTGAILDELPGDVTYFGIDLNARHIETARAHRGGKGRFHTGDFSDARALSDEPYTLILALGLLHHLDDNQTVSLLELSRALLAPGGRLITIDPAYHNGQPWLARFLIDRDSGQAVRTEGGYVALSQRVFSRTDHEIYTDLLRVPYTHCAMVHHP